MGKSYFLPINERITSLNKRQMLMLDAIKSLMQGHEVGEQLPSIKDLIGTYWDVDLPTDIAKFKMSRISTFADVKAVCDYMYNTANAANDENALVPAIRVQLFDTLENVPQPYREFGCKKFNYGMFLYTCPLIRKKMDVKDSQQKVQTTGIIKSISTEPAQKPDYATPASLRHTPFVDRRSGRGGRKCK